MLWCAGAPERSGKLTVAKRLLTHWVQVGACGSIDHHCPSMIAAHTKQ
jgi:hypothetical protein